MVSHLHSFRLHDKEELMLQELFKKLKVEGSGDSEKIRNLIRAMYKHLQPYVYPGEAEG